MLQHKAGKETFQVEDMPLNFCVAETQGSIGALIEEGLRHIFAEKGWEKDTVTMLTHVEVDANDPLFQNPTKPIGPYVSKEEADLYHEETGDIYREDPKGNGWRKVVASPKPLRIQNVKLVKQLAEQGIIVVTVGGGGIPVAMKDGYLKGVQAVIDKDLSEAKKYLEEKHFTEGSMAPKVRAAIQYVEKSGKTCIITEAGRLQDPNCGTRIIAG